MAFATLLLLLAASAAASAAASPATLGVLDLSLRGLTTLNAASLSPLNFTFLTLNLSGNAISSWGTRPFRALPNVTVLDLSRNHLPGIDAVALGDISRVRELNLSDNAVESLAGRPFRALVKLVHLDLSNNKLRTLDGSSLGDLVALQRLSLRGNALVALEDADLRGLSRLQWLDVSNNAIQSAAAGALRGLNGLGELSAGDNPDVGSIVVVGRRLLQVSMPRAGLTAVPASLTRSVRRLILQGNLLTAIESGDLDSYPLLSELDLSFNKITSVEDDALGRLEQLTVLRLSGNRLRVVPPGLPASLVTLQLDTNLLVYLSSNDFQGLHQLQDLSLGNNLLRDLSAGAFRSLNTLQHFDLSYNPLRALHADALEGLSHLLVLHLKGLEQLESPASWLPFPVASERLAYLDVSYSPVLAAQLLSDTAALTAMRQLGELRIKNCALTTLRSDLPSLLTHTHQLQLSGNQWNCSESLLLWLPTWIATLEVDDARCTWPKRVRGRLLRDLPKLNLKSNSTLNTTPTSAIRRDSPISTTPPATVTVHSSSIPTSPQASSSVEQKRQASTPAATSVRQNLTTSKSSPSPSSRSTTPTPSTETSTNLPTESKDFIPETSEHSLSVFTQGDVKASSPADKLNQEISSTRKPFDKKDPPNINLTPLSTTQVRDKHSGEPQQEAINFTVSTPPPTRTRSLDNVLSLITETDEAPSIPTRKQNPSVTPSSMPSAVPSTVPTTAPSTVPTTVPSTVSYTVQSTVPTRVPSTVSSTTSSTVPSTTSSTVPTTVPSTVPTTVPSTAPSTVPSTVPSTIPSTVPSTVPTTVPSTARQNTSDETTPDSQGADLSHKRIPLPSREALTAERSSKPPGSHTSPLLAMFGVGAVGSALVLLVLAAAHAAPKPRLDLVSFANPRDDDTREDDDDDSRTELW